MLAEQFPESKTSVDKRRRTPLHFALGHTEHPANVATVVLLSGTGAALMADENGMLVSCLFVYLFCVCLLGFGMGELYHGTINSSVSSEGVFKTQ